ncbi:MAG: sigma-70 family RNA polymerase sigma factor [Actinomycetota bacterium]
MTDPDALLVKRAARGDTAAFGELMERHELRTYNLALRICGDAEDARDATQDAFLTAFRKLGSFRGDSAFTTWLHRVTVNASLDLLRKKRRTPVVALADTDDDRPSAVEPALADHADDVTAAIDAAAALALVPEEFRAAIVLRDVFDLTYEEVATILEVPIGTVRSRLHRGRLTLARAIRDPFGEPSDEQGSSNPQPPRER